MALQLILGGSGQGKTDYLMKEIIRESLENPSVQYYMLVPEQFSLEMQRQMARMHPRHGFTNIEVVSFHRLAYRVFDECGYQPKQILEDLGVSMILKKLLMEHEDELVYFRRSLPYPGFLDQIKSALMEFINYGIKAEDLLEISGSLSSRSGLGEKCQELGMILGWFMEDIRDRYMVAGQILDVVKDFVPDSAMLREGIFYLDGYTGFTPVQLQFLRRLLPLARTIKVSVTIPYLPEGPENRPGEDLFSFSEKTIYALWRLCKETGVNLLDPVLLDRSLPPRFGENKGLAHLEKNLFRIRKEICPEPVSDLHMISCENPEEEVDFVLHKMEELVRTRDYRYRDFAILMGNEEDYPSVFQRKCEKLDIPCFLDTRQKMTYHSGVETVRALFHLARMDYSYESVFRYLKSGLSDFQGEEADYLENYIYSSGLRGLSAWSKPFSRRLNSYTEDKIELLDSLRCRLLSETMSFTKGMRDKKLTVREKMEVLYETLCNLHFPEKMKERSQEAESLAHFEKAKGYELFFAQLLALMDKIVDIFGEEMLDLKELSDLFDAGLETITFATPPLSMDQAILGDLKRTRLPDIKVLFFVGMNDGDIPPVPEDQGILSDEDKRILEDHGIGLSLNLTDRVLEDEYYLYLALAKAREDLYLCCCQTGADGNARRPSTLFSDLRQIFPQLELLHYPRDIRRYYFNEKDSREYLIRQLRLWYEGQHPEEKAFYALLAYWQEEHPEELQDIWHSMESGSGWDVLSKETVEKLYGRDLIGSVTRMEEFSSCPFRYFCDYGLGIRERKEFKVYNVDLGNLFHGALEYFSNLVKKRGYRWKDIPEDSREAMLDEAVDAVMDPSIRDVMDSSARNRYKKQMVRRILARTVKVLCYHLRNSAFEPDRFELKFGPGDSLEKTKIPLEDGHRIALNGVIDRVDLYEEDDKIYLKIIDYKSGTTQFDINELYYGLQMQLVVYLNAAVEIYRKETGKEVEPAGIFYYQLQDPIQDESKVSGEKGMNAFRMTGYANSDTDIIDLLEHDTKNLESFSLSITNAGVPSKRSNVWETADFHRVGKYVTKTMKEIGDRIYAGEIKASPYQLGGQTPCSYCSYRPVCGFEADDPRQEVRLLEKYKKDEIIDKIREEVKEDELHP